MSSFFGINIALKGMMTAQTALNVTANNIANANTEGYTRQRAEMVESPSISGLVTGAQMGSGVDIADVTRIRNDFLDYQLRTQTSSLQYEETISDTLSNVETVLNESSDDTGLSSQLDGFWNAWQDVATTPDSSAVRTTLKETAVSLTDTIRQLNSQFTNIQDDIKTQIDQTIENVNVIAEEIAKLNDQIVNSEIQRETPNDLIDARDLLLDKLSAMGDITVTNSKDSTGKYTGAVDVKLGSKTIVQGNVASTLSSSDIDSYEIKDGSLAALVHLGGSGDSADTIQYYIDKLNTLALGIAESVNSIHKTGKDLNEGSDTESDTDFFVFKDSGGNIITDKTEFNAGNIYVNPVIENDVSKIAASTNDVSQFIEGNGDTAREIADLKDVLMDSSTLTKPTSGTGVITIGSFYANMATVLGSQVNKANTNVHSQQTLVDNLTNKKESISGVSLDEETANTLLYQHALSACARIISTIDEMLDTIINMKA